MKIRLLIYGSLVGIILFGCYAYAKIEQRVYEQEIHIRQQKENWLYNIANLELDLALKASTRGTFWYHYANAIHYWIEGLDMLNEDLECNSIK